LLIEEYDYIFYVNPEGIEIEDNKVRETNPEYRNKIDASIKEILSKNIHRIKNYAEIQGTTTRTYRKQLNLYFFPDIYNKT
jgi:hypothetical protein